MRIGAHLDAPHHRARRVVRADIFFAIRAQNWRSELDQFQGPLPTSACQVARWTEFRGPDHGTRSTMTLTAITLDSKLRVRTTSASPA